ESGPGVEAAEIVLRARAHWPKRCPAAGGCRDVCSNMNSHHRPLRITVLGAGVNRCSLRGRLACPADATLVGRPQVLDPIRSEGLTMESRDGDRLHVPPGGVALSEEPSSVARADVVLVCTKAGSTAAATAEFAPHLHPDAVVVGLQNGLH